MPTYAIPTVDEMEALQKKKAPKPKPPCKWGPRKEDGYCPTKSEMTALSPSGAPAATSASSSRPTSSKKPCKYGDRTPDGYCPKKPKTQAQLNRATKAATAAIVQFVPEWIASGGSQAAKDAAKAVLAGGAIGTIAKGGLAAGVGAVGTAAAAALIAGAASYFGTTWILQQLEQQGVENTPEYRKYEAARAYRQARVELEKLLGRPLDPSEHAQLAAQFKENLAKIGG